MNRQLLAIITFIAMLVGIVLFSLGFYFVGTGNRLSWFFIPFGIMFTLAMLITTCILWCKEGECI